MLEKAGLHFEIIPSTREEKTDAGQPFERAEELSRIKALDIFESQGRTCEDILVIGADTIVEYDGQIMGKPRSGDEAFVMLKKLQGAVHRVYTGVTLCSRRAGEEKIRTFHVCTEVTFYPLEDEEIEAYVQTGEPMDKAGAYGIQGKGALFVERIQGDYNNVVGLPVARLCREMRTIW